MSARPRDFPGEYKSWKAMMQRERSGLCEVHEDFRDFGNFIAAVGAKPDPTYSLDRIDTHNRLYAPDTVRWASKTSQTRNRKNTIWLTYGGSKLPERCGDILPLAEWAELTNQKSATMRRRRSEGWTDDENIEGKRATRTKTFSEMSLQELAEYQPWDEGKKDVQERRYLAERNRDQCRLDFLLNVVQKQYRLNKLRRRFEGVAWYANDDSDYDCILQIDEDERIVDGPWVRQPSASDSDWSKLLLAWRRYQRSKAKIKARYSDWRSAVNARNLTTETRKKQKKADAQVLRRMTSQRFDD